jgi:hypothetical protein
MACSPPNPRFCSGNSLAERRGPLAGNATCRHWPAGSSNTIGNATAEVFKSLLRRSSCASRQHRPRLQQQQRDQPLRLRWAEIVRATVNEAKSVVARPEERKFLGFSISNDGSERRIAPKALDKFKTQIRDTRRTRG